MGFFDTLFGGTKMVDTVRPEARAGYTTLAGMIPSLATAGTGPAGTAANTALTDTLTGKYLGEGNPYLSQMADAIRRQYDEALGAGLNRVGQNAQLAGVPYSSRTAVLGARVARQGANDLAGQLANLFGGSYENERSRMTSLIPTGIEAGNMPMNQALQIAGLMRGTEQPISQPGILGGIGQLAAGTGALGGWLWKK